MGFDRLLETRVRLLDSSLRSERVAVLYRIDVRVREILTRVYRKTLILLDTCLHGAQVA